VKIAIRVYWFLDTLVYIGMIGGCLAGLLVGWLVMIPAGYELIVCEPDVRDIVLSGSIAEHSGCFLVARRKILKPDWNPPKLKNGWLTWDGKGGWWWWFAGTQYTDQYGWVDPSTGGGGDGEEIGEVMAEFLGFPDCTGFDERNCIWEVGR